MSFVRNFRILKKMEYMPNFALQRMLHTCDTVWKKQVLQSLRIWLTEHILLTAANNNRVFFDNPHHLLHHVKLVSVTWVLIWQHLGYFWVFYPQNISVLILILIILKNMVTSQDNSGCSTNYKIHSVRPLLSVCMSFSTFEHFVPHYVLPQYSVSDRKRINY